MDMHRTLILSGVVWVWVFFWNSVC